MKMFTANDARNLQLEGDVNKRTDIIKKFRQEIWDNNEVDNDRANILYDIVLVAQTQMTRTLMEYIPTNDENIKLIQELKDAGYTIDIPDKLKKENGSIVLITF